MRLRYEATDTADGKTVALSNYSEVSNYFSWHGVTVPRLLIDRLAAGMRFIVNFPKALNRQPIHCIRTK